MRAFLSKRINLLLFVSLIFALLGILVAIILPNYLFRTNMRDMEEHLKYISNNHTEIVDVGTNDRLYIYQDGDSTLLLDVGYVEEINQAIEVHLIHWSEEQELEEVYELFYVDDFQEKNFVYYIEIVEENYYVVAFTDTSDVNDLILNFRLYSIIFVFVLYILSLIGSSTFLSGNLIKKYSFYDPVSILNSKIAFYHSFDKKRLKKYQISYHQIFNMQNIIDACGITNSDLVLHMVRTRLLSVFNFEHIYHLSESEFIILSNDQSATHNMFKTAINKSNEKDDIIPYEFRVKTVIVNEEIINMVDAKTLINRIRYAFLMIKNSQDELTYVGQALFDKLNEEIYYQSRLQEAIDKNYLQNYYQIKVNPNTNKAVGAEALSRWLEDDKVVSPAKYIHIAEATGMIYYIDLISFKNTCETISKLAEEGLLGEHFRLSTNFSPITLKNITISQITDVIKETGIKTQNISIEVTESVSLEFDKIRQILEDITKLGIKIEIDDFSAGNSSFTVLPLMNASTVKLDMAILPTSINNTQEVLVYDSLISISKKLDLEIIAEGVETKEQVEYLMNHNIYGIQGYYYSKPIPLQDFMKLVRKYSI